MDEAVRHARAKGHKVSALTLLSLWPLPESALRRAMAGVRRVVVAELNDGQMRREIERLAYAYSHQEDRSGIPMPDPTLEVVGLHRQDGELITPQQFDEQIRSTQGGRR
jgi:2-oxoglutarate ferredoxin oxidoreductase subunit alpha